MTIIDLIALLSYDIELGQQFLTKALVADDVPSINYWVGWKSAKEQDLARIKSILQ